MCHLLLTQFFWHAPTKGRCTEKCRNIKKQRSLQFGAVLSKFTEVALYSIEFLGEKKFYKIQRHVWKSDSDTITGWMNIHGTYMYELLFSILFPAIDIVESDLWDRSTAMCWSATGSVPKPNSYASCSSSIFARHARHCLKSSVFKTKLCVCVNY